MDIVNTKLLFSPANWVIIFLMILIAGIVIHLVLTFYGVSPSAQSS